MGRVKALLLDEAQRAQSSAAARAARGARRVAAQVASARQQARAAQRRAHTEALKQWRHDKATNEADKNHSPTALLDALGAGRERKARLYGHGGKRGKHAKNPTATSSAQWQRDWSTCVPELAVDLFT